LNTWTFLAGTYDGSKLSLYVNGVLAGSVSLSGSIFSTSDPLRIGGDWSGEMFTGTIDDVRIYSTALTQAQIQSDMNQPAKTSALALGAAPSVLFPVGGAPATSPALATQTERLLWDRIPTEEPIWLMASKIVHVLFQTAGHKALAHSNSEHWLDWNDGILGFQFLDFFPE
jgi:hypothetical protein